MTYDLEIKKPDFTRIMAIVRKDCEIVDFWQSLAETMRYHFDCEIEYRVTMDPLLKFQKDSDRITFMLRYL